jgi:ATP-binding protein involved in chromosome partitioning
MSWLQCPHCNERIDVFSTGGGRRTANDMGIHFLGALPLDPQVRVGGDTGQPITTFGAGDARAKVFYDLAEAVAGKAAEAANIAGPTMTVSD